MAMTWTDVDSGSLAAGQPLKTGLMTDLRDNDEANSSKPVYIPIDETKTPGTSYPGTADYTYYTYCPEDAKVLRVRGALWASSGTAGVKLRIEKASTPAGYVEQEQTSTATAKGDPGGSADKTWTLSGLDNVSGDDLRGEEVKILVFFKNSASASTDIDCTKWVPSRWAVS